MLTEQQIREGVDRLTLDELVGQVLNYDMDEKRVPLERAEEIIRRTQPGSQYLCCPRPEYRDAILALQKKYCKTPVMLVADVECGLQDTIKGESPLPSPMAWGAADDADLVERTNHAVAQRVREQGVSLALAPVVDINMNFTNCLVNTRAISDSAEQVAKIGAAVVRGFQKDNLVAACCKHFPGDGVDQRNQHFCTSVNTLSKEEWMNTFGRVYQAMIEAGTMAIMVAHIALPAFDEKVDDILGYPPASLSKNLMTGLLKEQLGFEGCIVSDAMSMIGVCAMTDSDKIAVEFLKAGGDLVLFALPTDFDHIKAAVESGELPLERLKDAVRRVWRLKNKVGLFGDEAAIEECLHPQEDLAALAQEVADRSLCVVRDAEHLLPVPLKVGDKVLQVVVRKETPLDEEGHCLGVVEEELRARGVQVTTLVNPQHYTVKNAADEYDYVLFNITIDSLNYFGGTLRLTNREVLPLWRGYLLRHPRVIFTSFGDPYKLYDYPFAKTYINTFSPSPASQRAYVKALCGEIPFAGKLPVSLEGFFERQV